MLAAIVINSLIVATAVSIHYEMLFRLSQGIPKLKMVKHRFRVVVGVLGALAAHALEIWLFAFGYYFMIRNGNFGSLTGNFEGQILDCVYFSFSTYTSLGLGDIEPRGDLRFLAGIEALTGLVLITWTASFMFLEMQKFWKVPPSK